MRHGAQDLYYVLFIEKELKQNLIATSAYWNRMNLHGSSCQNIVHPSFQYVEDTIFRLDVNIGARMGQILSFSDDVPALFGYTTQEFQQLHTINALIPAPISGFHNQLVDQFLRSFRNKFYCNQNKTFAQCKSNGLMEIALYMAINSQEPDYLMVSVFLNRVHNQDIVLFLNERLEIINYSQSLLKKIFLVDDLQQLVQAQVQETIHLVLDHRDCSLLIRNIRQLLSQLENEKGGGAGARKSTVVQGHAPQPWEPASRRKYFTEPSIMMIPTVKGSYYLHSTILEDNSQAALSQYTQSYKPDLLSQDCFRNFKRQFYQGFISIAKVPDLQKKSSFYILMVEGLADIDLNQVLIYQQFQRQFMSAADQRSSNSLKQGAGSINQDTLQPTSKTYQMSELQVEENIADKMNQIQIETHLTNRRMYFSSDIEAVDALVGDKSKDSVLPTLIHQREPLAQSQVEGADFQTPRPLLHQGLEQSAVAANRRKESSQQAENSNSNLGQSSKINSKRLLVVHPPIKSRFRKESFQQDNVKESSVASSNKSFKFEFS